MYIKLNKIDYLLLVIYDIQSVKLIFIKYYNYKYNKSVTQ
jgi:hypothetical protein